jgi:hypothetical protein
MYIKNKKFISQLNKQTISNKRLLIKKHSHTNMVTSFINFPACLFHFIAFLDNIFIIFLQLIMRLLFIINDAVQYPMNNNIWISSNRTCKVSIQVHIKCKMMKFIIILILIIIIIFIINIIIIIMNVLFVENIFCRTISFHNGEINKLLIKHTNLLIILDTI